MATSDLCFTCYRRSQRRIKEADDDLSAARKAARQIRTYSAIMALAAGLGCHPDDMRILQSILGPYVDDIADYVQVRGKCPVRTVNQNDRGAVDEEAEDGDADSVDDDTIEDE